MTHEGLARFEERWLARGWVERFAGSKGLRDTVVGVKGVALCAGEFPGDGQPKPVVFPDPATIAVEDRDGLLIQKNGLPRDYDVDAYVRAKSDELWLLAQVDDDR